MKHKHYLSGSSLIVVFLLFSQLAVAQLVVDFSQSIGGVFDEYGAPLAGDKVRMNHVLVLTQVVIKNPFSQDYSEYQEMMPYDVIFKACVFDGKNALLAIKYRPIDGTDFIPLFNPEPPCQQTWLNFSNSCAMALNRDDVQINNISEGYPEAKNAVFNFDPFRIALVENEASLVTTERPLPNQITISVNWSNDWLDLDAHLTGPAPGIPADYNHESNRFHVYFGTKTHEVSNLYTDEFGDTKPEKITISPPPMRLH
jgi:hypothetical protein